MEIASITAIANGQLRQDPSQQADVARRADIFGSALKEARSVQELSPTDLGGRVIDSLRTMQTEFKDVMGRLVDESTLNKPISESKASGPFADIRTHKSAASSTYLPGSQAFGSNSDMKISAGMGSDSQSGSDVASKRSEGAKANTFSNEIEAKAGEMYSLTRGIIQTQVHVAKVMVTEELFSSTAGKLQKSNDMLLRGQ